VGGGRRQQPGTPIPQTCLPPCFYPMPRGHSLKAWAWDSIWLSALRMRIVASSRCERRQDRPSAWCCAGRETLTMIRLSIPPMLANAIQQCPCASAHARPFPRGAGDVSLSSARTDGDLSCSGIFRHCSHQAWPASAIMGARICSPSRVCHFLADGVRSS
jgi:hypothetical protein